MKLSNYLIGLPKLGLTQVIKPLRVAMRKPQTMPQNQQQFADLVNHALVHEIRAGYHHRFITLLFVTVGERVFCRRYTYSEPSWYSVFIQDPKGQVKLDKTIVNIKAQVPEDMENVVAHVDYAYAEKLAQLGAGFMLEGAIDSRAQASTIELFLDGQNEAAYRS